MKLTKDEWENLIDKGVLEGIKNYIDNGFDINQKIGWPEETALMKAVIKGNIKIAQLLIENGADISLCDKDGRNLFQLALLSEDSSIIKYINDLGILKDDEKIVINTKLLVKAMIDNDFELVKLLVEKASTFQPSKIDYDDYEIYEYDNRENNNLSEFDEYSKYYLPFFDLDKFIKEYYDDENNEIDPEIIDFLKNKIDSNELFIINPIFITHSGGYDEMYSYKLNNSEVNEFLKNGDDISNHRIYDSWFDDVVDDDNFAGGEHSVYYDNYDESVSNLVNPQPNVFLGRKMGYKEEKTIDFTKYDNGYYVLKLGEICNYREFYFIPKDLKPYEYEKFHSATTTIITNEEVEYDDYVYYYKGECINDEFIAQGYWDKDSGMGYGYDISVYQVKNGVCISADDVQDIFDELCSQVEDVISNPDKINDFLEDGTLPLIETIFYGLEDFTQKLIDLGADVNKKDKFENFPLIEAVNQSKLDLVKILIEKGANINEVNKFGETALTKAEKLRYTDIKKYLETL